MLSGVAGYTYDWKRYILNYSTHWKQYRCSLNNICKPISKYVEMGNVNRIEGASLFGHCDNFKCLAKTFFLLRLVVMLSPLSSFYRRNWGEKLKRPMDTVSRYLNNFFMVEKGSLHTLVFATFLSN